jgi:hypothetical protein
MWRDLDIKAQLNEDELDSIRAAVLDEYEEEDLYI